MENQPANPPGAEETLDPGDWSALRALGHQMLDDALDTLQTVRQRPVWQPVSPASRQYLRQPLPRQPQELDAVYSEFCEHILSQPMGNIHPRFWGWVIGTGDPVGVLAEMLSATLNPNLGGGDHVANYVEQQVLDWLRQIMGFPEDAGGILVTGGSMANLVGLTVARNIMASRAGVNLRQVGVRGLPAPLVFYASVEAHSSIQKAVEVLGLGTESLRQIPVDADFCIRLDLLREAITRDRQAGRLPACVIGNAGTVNTGATDDLPALAELCRQEGLWFHVDGAFGALAVLAPGLAPLVEGLQQADSLAFDLHKWMSVPIDAGCALVRRPSDQLETFALHPAYLAHTERGLGGGNLWFGEYGIELSRSFRALKAWMMLKVHGSEKFGRLIQQNVDQARYLSGLVDATPALERLAPTALNIVCFRYVGQPGRYTSTQLDALNQELLFRLHESGVAAPSYTTINGQYALRVANVNQRSVRADFDLLVSEVLRIGKSLESESLA